MATTTETVCVAPPTVGALTGYSKYRCRCPRCREAAHLHYTNYALRRRATGTTARVTPEQAERLRAKLSTLTALGWSHASIARATGGQVSHDTVRGIIRGTRTRPRQETATALLGAFDTLTSRKARTT